jgi:hypothetical protein
MAKIKSPTPKLRLAHWTILFLLLLVVPTAIYAMTTWSDPTGYNVNPTGLHQGSQLPDQSHMTEGLQGRPANSQDLGNSSSAQLQPSTAAQSPQPQDMINNPSPCPQNTDIACTLY